MDKINFKALWRWCGWLPNLLFAILGGWLRRSDVVGEVTLAILIATGNAIFYTSIVCFLVWIGYFILELTPGQRLKRLVPIIDPLAYWIGFNSSPPWKFNTKVRSLARKLDKLKIPHPEIKDDPNNWKQFLRILLAEAEVANIKRARQVFTELK